MSIQNEDEPKIFENDEAYILSESQHINSNDNEYNNSLITLNCISKCQQCNNIFDSNIHIPYLFKCGHFFCKQCIETVFTDNEGIKCPNDGLIAYSLSNLKLLTNLITDNKEIDIQLPKINFCEIHKEQKVTHYIENTKEVFCVYCAFSKYKKNPKIEIKEIKDKHNEMLSELNDMIENNQYNIKMIQNSLEEMKKNKESEEQKVIIFYEYIMNFYKNKKEEILTNINLLYTENERNLTKLLEVFSNKIDQSETLKNEIKNGDNNKDFSFLEILEKFNKLVKGNFERNRANVQLNEYNFVHEDENKILKLINTFEKLQKTIKYSTFNRGKDININNHSFISQNSTVIPTTNVNSNIKERKVYENINIGNKTKSTNNKSILSEEYRVDTKNYK